MKANDYSRGIDGRGYPLDCREISKGDRLYFHAYIDGQYHSNQIGTVTRAFKYTVQVNGKPVQFAECPAFLNLGITGKLWFQRIQTTEY